MKIRKIFFDLSSMISIFIIICTNRVGVSNANPNTLSELSFQNNLKMVDSKKIFDEFDSDKRGYLNRKEIPDAVRCCGLNPSEEDILKAFRFVKNKKELD